MLECGLRVAEQFDGRSVLVTGASGFLVRPKFAERRGESFFLCYTRVF